MLERPPRGGQAADLGEHPSEPGLRRLPLGGDIHPLQGAEDQARENYRWVPCSAPHSGTLFIMVR